MCPSGEIWTPGLLSFSLSYTVSFFCLVAFPLPFTSLTVTCHLSTCLLSAGLNFSDSLFLLVTFSSLQIMSVQMESSFIQSWPELGINLSVTKLSRKQSATWAQLSPLFSLIPTSSAGYACSHLCLMGPLAQSCSLCICSAKAQVHDF